MAEGQTKKDVIKKAAKKPAEPAKTAETATSATSAASDVAAQAIRNVGEAASPSSIGSVAADVAQGATEEVKNLRAKKGIASGLKDLSKRGALTGGLLKEARQRATKAGVSEEQFSSFMDKEGIKAEDIATAAPTESKEEAAQNVMFQRQYGTGLGTLAAMQDPNYELGSGSALRQPARSIGPASGKFRRASRRLRRQGYGGAAQQMAMAGEVARMQEPSIDTPALRGQRMLQKMTAAKEARKQDKIASGSKDMFGAMGVKKPRSKKRFEQRDIKMPMAQVNLLEKTRNEEEFGAIKRQGQRI